MCFTLEEIKHKSIPLAQKYGVKRLGLFGSYARGEADENSDLNFLISKGEMRGLFQYMGFVLDLEDGRTLSAAMWMSSQTASRTSHF